MHSFWPHSPSVFLPLTTKRAVVLVRLSHSIAWVLLCGCSGGNCLLKIPSTLDFTASLDFWTAGVIGSK
jgi:hypothetical protein